MSLLAEILERLEVEDDQQREANLPPAERNRSIPRDVGEYLSVFIRGMKPMRIVEVGTSVGYSTLWLGMAAKSYGGNVISYEIDENRAIQAAANIKEAGLDNIVQVIHKDVMEAEVPTDIDLIFFDQEKSDYYPHFLQLFPKLKPGGIIIADNVISHFEELRKYIEHVRDHPDCDSVMNPIGRGLEITYKHSETEFEEFKNNVFVR